MYRMDWTDDRLQERFDSIDRRFDEVDRRLDVMHYDFREMSQRFESLNRTLLQIGGGIIAALIALIATQL
jgi:tetrahydromethanopterin S-methyltransferase subunit G